MRTIVHAMQTNRGNVKQEKDRQMVVRLPAPLYERLQEIAESEQRTLSAEVRWLMQRRVQEQEGAA